MAKINTNGGKTAKKTKSPEAEDTNEQLLLAGRILAASPNIVLLLDNKGIIIFNNPVVRSVLGFDDRQITGHSFFGFVHSDDLAGAEEFFLDFQSQQKPRPDITRLRLKHSDGFCVNLEINARRSQGIDGTLFFCRDITDQTLIEEGFKNSRDFLMRIIEAVSTPIFVKDSNYKFVMMNEAYCRLMGPDRVEMFGKSYKEIFPDDELYDNDEKSAQVFLTGQENISEEILLDADNNIHAVTISRSLYTDSTGQPFVVGLMHDETKRKEAESEIHNALMKAKELNELKSKFISMVSHEYRTPLTSILSSAELLELFSPEMKENEKLEHLDKIKRSVEYLTDLLNDVLVLNRTESGRLQFNPAPLELVEFCNSVILELTNGRNNINFYSSAPKIEAAADKKLLKYVFSNLLANAIKYSPENSPIEFTLSCWGKFLDFRICDKGIGIPEKDQAYLFDPFFRASNASTVPGSGLGLSIVKNCAEMHYGSLSLKSSEGKGTSITLRIPFISTAELWTNIVKNFPLY